MMAYPPERCFWGASGPSYAFESELRCFVVVLQLCSGALCSLFPTGCTMLFKHRTGCNVFFFSGLVNCIFIWILFPLSCFRPGALNCFYLFFFFIEPFQPETTIAWPCYAMFCLLTRFDFVPVSMFQIAPAIMTGNTVVCKPSEFTSVTAYKLAEVRSIVTTD